MSDVIDLRSKLMMKKFAKLQPYEVYEFSWGVAVKHRKGKWERIFLKPDAQEIDVSNLDVIVHEYGIEFTCPAGRR